MIDLAIKLAKQNNSKFKFGAVARRADGAIVHATNNRHFHPINPEISVKDTPLVRMFSHGHAENRLAYRAGVGSTVWVVRLLQSGELGMAKPCCVCEKIMRFHGIKDVYFSNNDGEIERIILNK